MTTQAGPRALTSSLSDSVHLPLSRLMVATPHEPAYFGVASLSTGMNRTGPSYQELGEVNLCWGGMNSGYTD